MAHCRVDPTFLEVFPLLENRTALPVGGYPTGMKKEQVIGWLTAPVG